MPNIKSAKKRAKQNIKSYDLNKSKKSTVRTYEKKVRKAVAENKKEEAQQFLSMFFSKIDKAAKTNLFHKNTASRKKSRLTSLVSKVNS